MTRDLETVFSHSWAFDLLPVDLKKCLQFTESQRSAFPAGLCSPQQKKAVHISDVNFGGFVQFFVNIVCVSTSYFAKRSPGYVIIPKGRAGVKTDGSRSHC